MFDKFKDKAKEVAKSSAEKINAASDKLSDMSSEFKESIENSDLSNMINTKEVLKATRDNDTMTERIKKINDHIEDGSFLRIEHISDKAIYFWVKG